MYKSKIYYGMSGTFKATTIKSIINKTYENVDVIWSDIKPWKRLENTIFKNKVSRNDLNYAMLHLCKVRDYFLDNKRDILIERGVSDMLFYYLNNNGLSLTEELTGWINSVVEEESDIIEKSTGNKPEKILLIQKDRDFVRDVILKEKTRSDEFKDLDDYFIAQERYIEFTSRFNNISETIVINNAKNYIENNLNLEFNV